jgi:hypothetical protein
MGDGRQSASEVDRTVPPSRLRRLSPKLPHFVRSRGERQKWIPWSPEERHQRHDRIHLGRV